MDTKKSNHIADVFLGIINFLVFISIVSRALERGMNVSTAILMVGSIIAIILYIISLVKSKKIKL